MPNAYAVKRHDDRITMEVAVYLSGHHQQPGVETTLTENISAHGACVRTRRQWTQDEHLVMASLPGNFQSLARVAYCCPRPAGEFLVGVEFVQTTGQWTQLPAASPQERRAS